MGLVRPATLPSQPRQPFPVSRRAPAPQRAGSWVPLSRPPTAPPNPAPQARLAASVLSPLPRCASTAHTRRKPNPKRCGTSVDSRCNGRQHKCKSERGSVYLKEGVMKLATFAGLTSLCGFAILGSAGCQDPAPASGAPSEGSLMLTKGVYPVQLQSNDAS